MCFGFLLRELSESEGESFCWGVSSGFVSRLLACSEQEASEAISANPPNSFSVPLFSSSVSHF